jgi:hypothetical protein
VVLVKRSTTWEEVSTVAATIDIEVESGVYAAPTRRHQGYWAGDFTGPARVEASTASPQR